MDLLAQGCAAPTPSLSPRRREREAFLAGGHDRVLTAEQYKFPAMFDHLCKSFPAWRLETSELFWRMQHLSWHKLKHADFLVCSLQRYGTCFLHAPVVLHHYLYVGGTQHTCYDRVDICSLISGSEDIKERYLGDLGGDSVEVFKQITGLSASDLERVNIPDVRAKAFPLGVEDLVEAFREFGPALISGMLIENGFVDPLANMSLLYAPASPIFKDPTTGRDRGHSMVLIGHREGLVLRLALLYIQTRSNSL